MNQRRKMAHYSFQQIVEAAIDYKFGMESSSATDAYRAARTNGTDQLAALVTIAGYLKEFREAIALSVIRDLSRKWLMHLEMQKKGFLEWREEKHGPVPYSVEKWLDERLFQKLGMHVGFLDSFHGCRLYLDPPKKVDWCYNEYRAWMRRRPKKVKKAKKTDEKG